MNLLLKKNRIIVLCLSLVCMAAVYMNNKASAFPFHTVMTDEGEKTFELFSQQKSKQYAKTDFATAIQAQGINNTASGSGSANYSSDPGVDHILRVWCGYFPFMFATCEITSSALGVFVISTDGRILQKF